MKKQKRNGTTLTPQETQLMERLRSHPEMMARVQAILEIAHNEEGPLKTADEVEDLLVEEMRRLGNATMNRWAFQAEERVMTELKSQDATVLSRKKNAEVVCVRLGESDRADLVQPNPEVSAPITTAAGSDSPGTLPTTGTGADGLWLRASLCPGGGQCVGTLWV